MRSVKLEAGRNPRNPILGIFGSFCPHAASGHAAAAPPISVMNARRFIPNMVFPTRAAGFPHSQPSTEGPAGPGLTLNRSESVGRRLAAADGATGSERL